MKLFLIAILSVAAVLAESDFETWEQYKATHNKLYSNPREESKRFANFQEALKRVEEHNEKYANGEVTWYKGINRFSDWSRDEMRSFLTRSYNRVPKVAPNETFEAPLEDDVPSSIDWRQKGAVTPVKDQGDCGGCWAFSAVGTTEGRNFIKNNKLVSLSEQQLIDCAKDYDYGYDACIQGGVEQAGITYLTDKGAEPQSKYPYKGKIETCKYNAKNVAVKPKGYVQIAANAAALKAAVAQGPTTVAIDIDDALDYGGGIYAGTKCGTTLDKLNHAMTNVGYGTDNGINYWIIKNSWSTQWGEKGYIRIKMGSNICGVEANTCYAKF